jgi:hypothetical protein
VAASARLERRAYHGIKKNRPGTSHLRIQPTTRTVLAYGSPSRAAERFQKSPDGISTDTSSYNGQARPMVDESQPLGETMTGRGRASMGHLQYVHTKGGLTKAMNTRGKAVRRLNQSKR